MRKLWCANMARMWKTKIFWIGLSALAAISVWQFLDFYSRANKYALPMPEIFANSIFQSSILLGIVIAVCFSLVTGTEYDEGTIRNKLVIGQARTHIYLADWMSCFAASLIQAFAAVFAVLLAGFVMVGTPDMQASHFLKVCLVLFFVCMSYVSVFHLISMLVTSKSHAAMINVLLALALLVIASVIAQYLNAPEMMMDYRYTEDGMREIVGKIPNPDYLRGTKRAVYQFLYDFLPSGQNMQVSIVDAQHKMHTALLCLYSAIVTIGTNVVGIFVFQRKDLK